MTKTSKRRADGTTPRSTVSFLERQEIVHIAPEGEAPATCGAIKGRATRDPHTAVLVVDRYCLRCYKKWEKSESSNLRG